MSKIIDELRERDLLDEAQRIAREHHCTVAEMMAPNSVRGSREKHIAAARHEFAAYLKHELKWSYPAIGRLIGGRDHTSIIAGVRKHDANVAKLRVA